MTLTAILFAATLLRGDDIPEAERIQRLSKYFSPAPESEVSLDEREVRDFVDRRAKKIEAPGRIRGWIDVKPPKGVCFTIRRADLPDEVVCKATRLSFVMDDLDKMGYLKWGVSTGEGDFGTPLTWKSRYRVAITTPLSGKPTDPPLYKYISKCEATSDLRGRRITVGMLTGETWIIRFPDEDELLPQPPPEANLFITNAGPKVSVKEASEAQGEGGEKKEGEGEKKEGEGKKAEEKKEEGKGKSKIDDDFSERSDRKGWSVPRRDAYGMSSDHFQPYGAVPPHNLGACRYTFKGPKEDPDTGRVECHDADGFESVLIPLICMGKLKPKT